MNSLDATLRETSAPSNGVGVLLTDASLHPVWFNTEAVQILNYPQNADSSKALGARALGEKIRASFSKQPLPSLSLPELWSGRRRYLCRTFLLTSTRKGNGGSSVAVLLERSPRATITLSKACEQFQFTRREREALESLSIGLDTKEMANSMQISTNTAKVHIRMVMAKMGVSTRMEVLAKILSMRPLGPKSVSATELSRGTVRQV
jgi:DNA-binding CsgD family transcriptional regulator